MMTHVEEANVMEGNSQDMEGDILDMVVEVVVEVVVVMEDMVMQEILLLKLKVTNNSVISKNVVLWRTTNHQVSFGS